MGPRPPAPRFADKILIKEHPPESNFFSAGIRFLINRKGRFLHMESGLIFKMQSFMNLSLNKDIDFSPAEEKLESNSIRIEF